MSLIARTAGIGRSAAELQWDLNYMLKLWDAIDGAAKGGKGAFLIYQESSLVIRAIRDYFTADIGEILIDTDDIYDQALQFMTHVMPETASRVKRYRDDAPLFSRFQIEHQIETAFSRTVNLPSGGAIVIDHTEALVSVDVNSARSTRGSDIEETATRTNLEAADETARQMRLRDLGGLIVVDFIDMDESKNRREVEQRLRDALRQDRARVQFSSISKFGLLELSRQRLRPALSEGSHITCPRCNGTGHIRDTESSALQILRMVQEESMKENTAAVHVQVPVEVTSFLLNEKRTEITKIELKQRVTVLLVPNKNLETPNYKLERLRHDDPRLENLQASYTMVEDMEEEVGITRRRDADDKGKNRQSPVIKGVLPDQPAPPAPAPEPVAAPAVATVAAPVMAAAGVAEPGSGFFGWIKKLFAAPEPAPRATLPPAPKAVAEAPPTTGERKEGRGGRGGRGGRAGSKSAPGESREPREGRDGRSGRGRRSGGDGPARGDRATPKPADAEASTTPGFVDTVPVTEAGPEGEGRRRRRRGGRGRGEGRTEPVAAGTDGADLTESPTDANSDDAASDRAPGLEGTEGSAREGRRGRGRGRGRGDRSRRDSAGDSVPAETGAEPGAWTEPAVPAPGEAPALTVAALPASTAAEAPAPAKASEPAPLPAAAAPARQAEPAPALPAMPDYVLPTDELQALADSAGLQWVGSDAGQGARRAGHDGRRAGADPRAARASAGGRGRRGSAGAGRDQEGSVADETAVRATAAAACCLIARHAVKQGAASGRPLPASQGSRSSACW